MLYVYEFEIFQDGKYWVALPFGLDGGTQGESLEDAIVQAAEWLHIQAVSALEVGDSLPEKGSLGNVAVHDGKVLVVAVRADITDAEAVSASEAARMLGISTARMAQLCSKGELVSWTVGSTRMVSTASIELRIAEAPKTGRPKQA